MATATHLAMGVKAGFGAIKEKMQAMAVEVKRLENKNKETEESIADARKRYHGAFVKMSELTMLMGEKEERLRRGTEKLKYSTERLGEKEGHVLRVKDWNRKITQIPAEQITETEQHLTTVRANYSAARQKLAAARSKVQELEEKIEKRENKYSENLRREDHLQTEFEHHQREYELKQAREAKQQRAASHVEEKYREMEKNFYAARRRHDAAAIRLKELEVRLSQTEVYSEEFKKKRVAMESTLRELLSSYSKNREVSPPPKYEQAGTAVNSSETFA